MGKKGRFHSRNLRRNWVGNSLHNLTLTSSAERDFKNVTKKNKEVEDLLVTKFEELQNIDIPEALRSRKVGTIEGIPPKILKRLEEKNFEPFIYEYRDFPKSHLFRIVFVVDQKTFFILWIGYHKEMKEKFNKVIVKKIFSILDR